jgi:hypothetical protein
VAFSLIFTKFQWGESGLRQKTHETIKAFSCDACAFIRRVLMMRKRRENRLPRRAVDGVKTHGTIRNKTDDRADFEKRFNRDAGNESGDIAFFGRQENRRIGE